MFALRSILAAGCLSTVLLGAPLPHPPSSVAQHASYPLVERSTANSYTVYGGTGAVTDGWPLQSSWISSFDDMFESNKDVMKASCAQWSVPSNTDDEISQLKSAIQSVSQSSGVDARYILAVVMQESNGCIRAPTTNYGVRNPGLMQSHDGAGTCNDASVQNPCPQDQILQMIKDGTEGTSSGDGLVGCIKNSGASDVSKYYMAARIYNSGSIDSSKNLGAGIATHCYASDIANRLTGWYSGTSGCDPASIGTFAGVKTSAEAETDNSSASSSTSIAGGAFIQQPASSTSAPASTTTIAVSEVSTPESTPTPSPTSSPVTTEDASTTAEPTTVTVSPLPQASSTSSSEPIESTPTPTPTPTSEPAQSTPAPTSTSSPATTTLVPTSPDTNGAQAPGSACPAEGTWNCVTKTTFQQCASGTWSVIQGLASGLECEVGQSMVIRVGRVKG